MIKFGHKNGSISKCSFFLSSVELWFYFWVLFHWKGFSVWAFCFSGSPWRQTSLNSLLHCFFMETVSYRVFNGALSSAAAAADAQSGGAAEETGRRAALDGRRRPHDAADAAARRRRPLEVDAGQESDAGGRRRNQRPARRRRRRPDPFGARIATLGGTSFFYSTKPIQLYEASKIFLNKTTGNNSIMFWLFSIKLCMKAAYYDGFLTFTAENNRMQLWNHCQVIVIGLHVFFHDGVN